MSEFEEKFKHLNFNKNENKNYDNVKETSEKDKALEIIFKELVKNISENIENDKMFLLMLMAMLKNKQISNDLILALLYIFM